MFPRVTYSDSGVSDSPLLISDEDEHESSQEHLIADNSSPSAAKSQSNEESKSEQPMPIFGLMPVKDKLCQHSMTDVASLEVPEACTTYKLYHGKQPKGITKVAAETKVAATFPPTHADYGIAKTALLIPCQRGCKG